MTHRKLLIFGNWAVATVAAVALVACEERGTAAYPDECQWHWEAFWVNHFAGVESGAELARRVKFCVDLGAGPNWRNPPTGWRVMHFATIMSLFGAPEAGDIMTNLVRSGADLELRDKQGLTPLLLAAALTDREILALRFTYESGWTIRKILANGGRGAIQFMFDEEMAKRENFDAQYDEANRRRTIERLIRLGADTEAKTDYGVGIRSLEIWRRVPRGQSSVADRIPLASYAAHLRKVA